MRTAKGALLAGAATTVFLAGLMLGSAGRGQATTAALDFHLKCYPIPVGSDPPHVVLLGDQFFSEKKKVGVAKWVCNPTTKQIVSGPPPLPNTGDHLVCYAIAGTKEPPNVDYANQLETQVNVDLTPGKLLCVPSAKRIHPPAG
jgi:hypothetical protein